MTGYEERYDLETAAAWILGHARRTGVPALPEALARKTADECAPEELCAVLEAGTAAGLKLYPFKRGTQTLQRTRRALGFLRSIPFDTMLDVGSGRGVFLIPFMKEFPHVRVTCLDLLDKRVAFLNELADGGFRQMHAERRDICSCPFPDGSFDVVTMLEVLEHIPEVEKAIRAAVRMARKFVVVTVPSKPDDNPEHIHLLTKDILTRMFASAGCTRLHFDGVEGHLFMTAAVDRQPD
ncbi:MAG: class I SAM-dependent methyltransferase [Clostridia bacterium]|nr:class I SAM-dependent methyltransferase [Clostridia bacterium]